VGRRLERPRRAGAARRWWRGAEPEVQLDGHGDPRRGADAAVARSVELRLPLRWIAILHRRFGISLAASTGVHTGKDVVKVLLAGADVAMMTSALLRHGPEHLRSLEVGVRDWMDGRGFETVDQLRGRLSQRSVPDPAAFERANYLKTLASHPASRR
jgi:dihydroorotate dehydrogenase (fumarate)